MIETYSEDTSLKICCTSPACKPTLLKVNGPLKAVVKGDGVVEIIGPWNLLREA
jgi:hypothetical protein